MPPVILLLLLVGTALGLVLWALGFFKPVSSGPFVPNSAPAGNWTSRIAEAIVLAWMATMTFISLSCFGSGRLLKLDQLRPELATVHVVVLCIAAGITVVSVSLALLWRTSVGAAMVLVSIFVYGWLVNAPARARGTDYLIESLAPKPRPEQFLPEVYYHLSPWDSALHEAELWVNKVYLGKLPVTIRMEEFLAKVPYMTQPPDGYDEEREPKGHWFELELPRYPVQPKRGGGFEHSQRDRIYYARVKLGDEWGSGYSGSRVGGTRQPRKGRVQYHCESRLTVTFASRQKRFANLIQKARLADFNVESAWFEVMETYEKPGWDRLRGRAKKEKGFEKLLDDWVRWKYGLGREVTADVVRRLFKQICDQADDRHMYDSSTVAGRAVAMIFDKLNLEQVIKCYVWSVKRCRRIRSGWVRTGDTDAGAPLTSQHAGDDVAPASTAVLEQAIMLWDAKLDVEDDKKPNIIEKKVVPALICWPEAIDTAYRIGGPAIERFLLRKFESPDGRTTEQSVMQQARQRIGHLYVRWPGGGNEVNPWAYLLTNLKGATGRDFRRRYSGCVINMGKEVMGFEGDDLDDVPGFLFMDNDRDAESIAVRLWPEYRNRAEREFADHVIMAKKWEYLAGMGQTADTEMFIEAWRKSSEKDTVDYAVGKLSRAPVVKQCQVIHRLIEELEKYAVELAASKDEKTARQGRIIQNNDIPKLWYRLVDLGNEKAIEHLVTELKENRCRTFSTVRLSRLRRKWALSRQCTSKLAAADSPAVKLFLLEALRAYPNRENRQMLEKLAADENEKVRQAAEKITAELKEIEEMPVEELVSHPGEK